MSIDKRNGQAPVAAMNQTDDIAERSLALHRELEGKIEVIARKSIETAEDLNLLYTPGVARPCLEIQKNPELSYTLTRRGNLVAVVTNGTAVLGLGNIGPEAAMPVMEGKCALFKSFGGVDAFPLCVETQDVEQFVEVVAQVAGSFGGVNLEDIAAPACFEIERRLKQRCDIPIFHDDQHGTAIVTLAGLLNALKVCGKVKERVTVVISGAGAAGISIAKLLLSAGFCDVTLCDSKGVLHSGRGDLSQAKAEIARMTELARMKCNKEHGQMDAPNFKSHTSCAEEGTEEGGNSCTSMSLADALVGADVFIGVSAAGLLTQDMVETMAPDSIVFACANPVPEIYPDKAKAGGARVVATGRSDFPNQINNVLVFPGVFKGALAVRASDITEGMKLRAAYALAGLVTPEQLSENCIIPSVLDKSVAITVADAVAEAAKQEHVNRV